MQQYKVENNKQDKDEFVSGIIVNKEGKVFRFIRKDNLKLDPGKKDFISGHIKNGEVPTQAMYREIREETGIGYDEIIQLYSLREIELPHPLIKNKTCQTYCVIIPHTEEKLNKSIKERATEKEIERAEQLENLEELKEDMRDENSNWRVFFSKELEDTIDIAKQIINQDKQKGIILDK